MFNKAELRALPVPQLPKKRSDAVYRAKGVEYIIRSGFALDGEMLIFAFYSRESAAAGFTLPTAVVYQTKDDFVTLFSKEGKRLWRKSRIMGQLNIREAKKELVFLGKNDEARAKSFLSGIKKKYDWQSGDTASMLGYLQDSILEKRQAESQKEQYRKLTEKINRAGDLPLDYSDWVTSQAMTGHQYIFYKRRGKQITDAYCTACKTEMVIERNPPVNMEAGVCPSCGHKATFRTIGRAINTTDKVYTSILQEAGEDEYVLRFFENTRCFKPAAGAAPANGVILKLNTDLVQTEVARVYFNGNGDVTDQYKCRSEVWRKTHNTIIGDDIQWEFRMYYQPFWHYWFEPGYLYPHNLLPLFDKLGVSYKLREKVCNGAVNVTTPILQHVKYPYLDSIAAKGLKRLYDDIMDNGKRFAKSSKAGKLHERLGVTKAFLEIAQKHRLTVKDFDLAASYGVELSEDDFLWLASEKPPVDTMTFLMQFCSVTDIRRYLAEKIIQMHRYSPHDAQLSTQMTHWRDYLQMCLRMNHDMTDRTILFPYDLRNSHRYMLKLSEIKPDPKWDAKIAGCYDRLYNLYHFEKDDYLIKPPRDYMDFAAEGSALLHCVCVNQYYIKHVDGTNLIFFVRKASEPDKPLYTIEYIPRTGTIKQCYGFDHCHPNSKVWAFLQDWRYFIGGAQRELAA